MNRLTVTADFKADFHLTYMTSSLVFATSTVGQVTISLTRLNLIFFHSFAIGTLLVERVIKALGRFHIYSDQRSFIPAIPLISRLSPFTSSSFQSHGSTGHSASQARFLLLILSSVLHACYFIIMGCKSGYPALLLAYSIAALARAYLTCELSTFH